MQAELMHAFPLGHVQLTLPPQPSTNPPHWFG
jgi:hypothetical protein